MTFRMPFTGTVSPACGPDCGACFTEGVVVFAAASTSSFVIRPRAPLPCNKLRSTPSSLASRFATGEALTRVVVFGVSTAVSYTHLTLPTIYSV